MRKKRGKRKKKIRAGEKELLTGKLKDVTSDLASKKIKIKQPILASEMSDRRGTNILQKKNKPHTADTQNPDLLLSVLGEGWKERS